VGVVGTVAKAEVIITVPKIADKAINTAICRFKKGGELIATA
jgi:hypothetical protein